MRSDQVQQRRHGIAVVDKAPGWTSHDVVAKARGILGNKKVGHSGTLDPDATGVLLLGVGRATRLLRFLTALPKAYTCEIVLGVETSTLDASGEVVATYDMGAVTPGDVTAAAQSLTGDIIQVPPMVSAVRVGGRRLHQLARQGKEVERTPRPVTVYEFSVTPIAESSGVYRAEVVCSSGTYVRSLAADLGRALGGGAHLRRLRRTRVGSFTETEARPLEDLLVLPPAEAVRDYPSVRVSEDVAAAVRHGKVLNRSDLGLPEVGDGPWAVLGDGPAEIELLAIYEPFRASTVKPTVVLVG
ncbi:MAG: tRNA pseudouridine(55) synthase TruB [Acidimicrobiales bacterium]|nr:tRNA pseudouridine(55) synthase TruB [Acidimicrobiales bacterium]